MSQTAAETALNVRRMIDDLDKDDYAISSLRMANIISGAVQALAARTHQPINASPPTTIVLSNGVFDYTISLANIAIRQILLASNGRDLVRIPLEELNARYRQDTSVPAASTSFPTHYALYETNTQLTRIRVGPTPDASAGTLLVYRDVLPASTSGDTSSIPFGNLMCQAVEASAAAECVLSMVPEERAKRMISQDVVQLWLKGVDDAVKAENVRQRMMGRSQTHVVQRCP